MRSSMMKFYNEQWYANAPRVMVMMGGIVLAAYALYAFGCASTQNPSSVATSAPPTPVPITTPMHNPAAPLVPDVGSSSTSEVLPTTVAAPPTLTPPSSVKPTPVKGWIPEYDDHI